MDGVSAATSSPPTPPVVERESRAQEDTATQEAIEVAAARPDGVGDTIHVVA